MAKEVKKTSAEWYKEVWQHIIEFRGWKTQESFYNEKITMREFKIRMELSTVKRTKYRPS